MGVKMAAEIVKDEAFLRQPSEPVKNLQEGIHLVRELNYAVNAVNIRAARELKRNPKAKPLFAAGLSAPQIGVLKQVCVVAIDDYRRGLVNPRIVAHASEKILCREGCLSFPGKVVETYRWP